jgi:hypothetical protein
MRWSAGRISLLRHSSRPSDCEVAKRAARIGPVAHRLATGRLTSQAKPKRNDTKGEISAMGTQSDDKVRVVARANLDAMCKYTSGMCHRYWIEKVTRSRVHVGYSNPDEYANEAPVYAVFPCYPSAWPDDKDNPHVVLECIRLYGGRGDEYDPIQSFMLLLDCPQLWRDPSTGKWAR